MKGIRQKSGMRAGKAQVRGLDMFVGATVPGRVYLEDVIGKHEFITYAAGVDRSGAVAGVEIIEYRETWGYEVRRPDWRRVAPSRIP